MAGGFSAPGVYRREIDLSDILVATGVSNGATVVRAKKGPVRRPVLVTNDKEYVEAFGEPYYVDGLDDKNPFEAAVGGSLVPELGYGSYGAIEFLKESNTLFVVRAFDDGDRYATTEISSSATVDPTYTTSGGIVVTDSPLDVFDTGERISTYDEYYRDSNIEGNLLVGYVGPGEDGDSYAITVETISPTSEWLYSYDEYPVEVSATQAKYGYDVPEVWIDGAEAYKTTGSVSADILTTDGTAVALANGYTPLVPLNAVNYDGGSTWDVYSALSGTDYQEIVPSPDANVTNWVSVVTEDGDWTITGDYTDPLGLNTGPISATGSYDSTYENQGSQEAVKTFFPIASDVIKISVFKRPDSKQWEELYANKPDEEESKLRDEPLEIFYGTMTPTMDADGNELFIERSINGNSKFIYVKADKRFGTKDVATDSTWDFETGFIDTSLHAPTGEDGTGFYVLNETKFGKLQGGAATLSPGLFGRDAEFWQYFENREELPVQILINPSFSPEDKQAVADLCNLRRDCIAANQVGDVTMLDYRDIINAERYGYPYASFMALYSGYSRVYDNYNDKYVYLPNALFGASLYARVDRLTDPWYAPAGVARGTLSVLDENKIFSLDQIGKMYDKNINSVKFVQGAGFVMWGQKTAQLKKSALDRINVRRNLIYIQTNIENSLNQFVFENNTAQTRLRVFSIIDEFLAGIKASDGLYDYSVVVDETNNTPSVIDSNQLNVDIYVQPTKTIEFIQFTTVITRTGVNFGDVQLKYA